MLVTPHYIAGVAVEVYDADSLDVPAGRSCRLVR